LKLEFKTLVLAKHKVAHCPRRPSTYRFPISLKAWSLSSFNGFAFSPYKQSTAFVYLVEQYQNRDTGLRCWYR